MTSLTRSAVRAVADLNAGELLASVELDADPSRVFRALTSREIVEWWVRPGVFNTTDWTGDVRAGGGWTASGLIRGQPWTLEGEFVEVDPPHKLIHTYGVGTPWGPTTVTYVLDALDQGTRITLRHGGFRSREACENNRIGWETSFERLAEVLASQSKPSS